MDPPMSLLNKYKIYPVPNQEYKFTSTEKKYILYTCNDKCYYCFDTLTKKNIHPDLYIPISKGGNLAYINIVASCESCYYQKKYNNYTGFQQCIHKKGYVRCIAINCMGKRCKILDKPDTKLPDNKPRQTVSDMYRTILCQEHSHYNLPNFMCPVLSL